MDLKKIIVDFKNCYGIRDLEYEFKFVGGNGYSIYAPNGFMKTSFSKSFMDIQNGRDSQDVIFPERETTRSVKVDGVELGNDGVFVIEPYNEDFNSDKASLLLVNKKLKLEYESAVKSIEEQFKEINSKLKQLSGLNGRTNTPELEIINCFGLDAKGVGIFEFIENILSDLTGEERFSNITYNEVFNDKTNKVLSSGKIKDQIQGYIEKYNDLVDNSPILSKVFNHSSAISISKNLLDSGFFSAKHSVNLFDGSNKKEIESHDELSEAVSLEKERILNDSVLVKKFEEVDKKLTNVDLRRFRNYLHDNLELLPELSNYQDLKKEIWLAYLFSIKDLLDDFVKNYKDSKKVIELVSNKAREEETEWEEVVDIFNNRFSVPFSLVISNQNEVILKSAVPKIQFKFKEGEETIFVDRGQLLSVLSQGEKRALYILNILFEINVRKKQGLSTLIVVDDIADSFDYKNKYSIIEYLKDIALVECFFVVFLTHNFDFHRTISSRIGVPRENRLFVVKKDSGLSFITEKYQNNPFLFWKDNLARSHKYLIASIPFVRNLAEYCGSKEGFLKLTSLLHFKSDTLEITISDLERIYKSILKDKSELVLCEPEKKVVEVIQSVALELSSDRSETVDLECKVILSIAIRLLAEEFMIKIIDDDDFLSGITSNQTFALFERFLIDNSQETNALYILEQVNLMTPENIHLNSFMYEPILDMSALHLYKLYDSVVELNK